MSLPESSLISVAFSFISYRYILFLRTVQKKIQEEKRKDKRKKANVLRAGGGGGEGMQGPCTSSNNEQTINTFVKLMVS